MTEQAASSQQRKSRRRKAPRLASCQWPMLPIYIILQDRSHKTPFHASAFTVSNLPIQHHTKFCPSQSTRSTESTTLCWMWSKKITDGDAGDNPRISDNTGSPLLKPTLDLMDQEIQASAKNKLDYNTLVKALSRNKDADDEKIIVTNNDWIAEWDALSQQQSQPTSTWQIALSAATVSAGGTFWLVTHNLYVTAAVFVVVFFLARQDPVQDDSLAGALARLLGRQTLQSYQASQPKLQALARAVVTGEEEVRQLRQQVQELQQQNQALMEWKEIRLAAEDQLSNYSLDELKELARRHKLPVGGTKQQVLVRLLEERVIPIK